MLPSLAIGVAAYGAGELIFHTVKKGENKDQNLYEILTNAKNTNNQIKGIIREIEDASLRKDIENIQNTASQIIARVEKKPEMYKKTNNFFDYYLPVTLNILKRYDEIENQRLITKDSQKFMLSAKNMIKKISEAFQNQLSNLYKSDMIDTDAEMKVFETMLKSDGYDIENDFNIKQGGKNEEK